MFRLDRKHLNGEGVVHQSHTFLMLSTSITSNYHMNGSCGDASLCTLGKEIKGILNGSLSSLMDRPATYRIQVSGRVSECWVRGFWDGTAMIVQRGVEAITTEMTGEVLDQAALVGLINILYNLGHVLISVERLTVGQKNDVTKK